MADEMYESAARAAEPTGPESAVNPLLKIATDQPDADTVVVAVAGEVDVSTAPALVQALDEALRGQPGRLVVDLRDVSFLGSAGLSALVRANRDGQDKTRLRVVADRPVTRRPLTLMGLDAVFTVCDSLDEALAG